MPTAAPYGSWKSPITAGMIAAGGTRLSEIVTDGDTLYWLESRPEESGRSVIVTLAPDGSTNDVTPAGFNVRNAVHEYGGGSYAVHDATVYFANWDDQRIYLQRGDSPPVALTQPPSIPRGSRYADLTVMRGGKGLLCIRETHSDDDTEAVNQIVCIDTSSGAPTVLASGNDFYGSPRAAEAHDGIVWLTWNHPDMPWDGCEMISGSLSPFGDKPHVATAAKLAGGQPTSGAQHRRTSIAQPRWSPDGTLHYTSDESNWWRLQAWRDGASVELLDADFDIGRPDWQFGFSSYTFLPDGNIAIPRGGVTSGNILILNPSTGSIRSLDVPYSEIGYIKPKPNSQHVYFVGASPDASDAIVQCNTGTGECIELRATMNPDLEPAYLAKPSHIIFPTTDDGEAHAWYYPPTNPDYNAPDSELPPLIVVCHGGPTSRSGTAFDPKLQYWTSRGFALVDVNYRGSSGYGTIYRDALKQKWGIYDTDDCIAAANYLKAQGSVDPDRVVIRGGSAGGYTTINALTFHDDFAAGAAYYGIADLTVFIGDTHKFESRYLDSLIGAYPQEAQRYHDRSAINFIHQLSTPMIILQGLEDEIVPPSQADIMVNALESKGIPHAYIGFPGEQHGFRKAENIIRAQEAELTFYGKVLGFQPADDIADDVVEVKNLD